MVDSKEYDYVGVLSRHIRLQPGKKNEIIRELESHLEDKASDLASQGMSPEAARRLAMQQMGDPVALAGQIQKIHTAVSLREMGLAIIPHLLIAGLVAFELCDSILAVAMTLAVIGGGAWLDWRRGSPGIWSHSWLGFTLAAPAIFLLMVVISHGDLGQALLEGSSYPVSMSLIFLFWCYVGVALWVMARIVYRVVGDDWLVVAISGLSIPVLTAWALVAQWLDPSWRSPLESAGLPGAMWVLALLTIAAITATYLKFGRSHLLVGNLLVATAFAVTFAYSVLLVDYQPVPARLAIASMMAILLFPALKNFLVSSLRALHSMFRTTLHLTGR